MSTETNQEAAVTPEATEGEGKQENQQENIVNLSTEEYNKLNETIGSLKRDLKDAKKTPAKTPEKTEKKDEAGLVEKGYLRTAGISKEDEVELALTTAKKWDMSIDKLVDDEDFIAKLEKHRVAKANVEATSNVKGDQNPASAKNSAEYWIAKGVPPTAEQVPDRKTRVGITKAFIASSKQSKTFYND